MSILSVKNLSKSFGKLEVLNDISFNVEQGEVISIIGPSGSGKSTLLRCINQFEKIDSGECEICGITMTRNDENGKAVYADNKTLHDIRLKIGLVFQNFNLFPHMSVLKNITEAPVHVLKQDKAQAEQTAMELLGKWDLRIRQTNTRAICRADNSSVCLSQERLHSAPSFFSSMSRHLRSTLSLPARY